MDDPAAQVITAAVGEDWFLADGIAAQWIDSGNADLLVDGLLDLCVTFLERLGECFGPGVGGGGVGSGIGGRRIGWRKWPKVRNRDPVGRAGRRLAGRVGWLLVEPAGGAALASGSGGSGRPADENGTRLNAKVRWVKWL